MLLKVKCLLLKVNWKLWKNYCSVPNWSCVAHELVTPTFPIFEKSMLYSDKCGSFYCLWFHCLTSGRHCFSYTITFLFHAVSWQNLFFNFWNFWLHWVFIAVHGLFLVAASGGYSSLWCTGFSLRWLLLLRSPGSRCVGFSSCVSWALERRPSICGASALLLCGMWDLPGPGIGPVSPALAGGFLTTVPPGKSPESFLRLFFSLRKIEV